MVRYCRGRDVLESTDRITIVMWIALTNEAKAAPTAKNTAQDWHLVSCLHAVGCVFAIQSVSDVDLNGLISAIENRAERFPIVSSTRLLEALNSLDWKTYMAEVADMHGDMNRDWYRKTTQYVIECLKATVKTKEDLPIVFFD